MAVIHKLSTQVLGGRDSNTYLGNKGDIVLDPTSMTFYYHDGTNRGGTPIIGSGGSAVFQQLALVGNQLSITGGNTVDLAAVGFSGDYNDLANAPIIPADRPDQTLTLTGSTLAISNGNSIELGSMLFSGSYDDLTNKPTIPVDQTLTLSGNTVTISGSWSAIDLTPILGSGGTSLPNGDLFATLSWNGADWVSSIPTAQYIYSGTSDADAETLMNLASGGGYPSGPNPAPQGTLYWNRLNQVVRIYTATGWQDLGGGGGSETLTTLSLTGTDLDYTDENGTLTTIDLSPFLPITETVTSLSLSTNILKYTDETGTDTDIDLSLYIDDTNLARLVSGTVAANGMATFTRDDTTTFDVDFSAVVGGSGATTLGGLTNVDSEVDDSHSGRTFLTYSPTAGRWVADSSSLEWLDDVNVATRANGDILVWDSTSGFYGQWVSKPIPAGGASAIDDLTDVDTTTTPPTNNDVLAWDGTNWVPATPASGGVDTFTNAAAMDANSLVTFTRNDGNTHTLDLATLDNRVAIGNTAPTSPVDGDLWYDELTSRTFVYVASATSWVDASPTTTDTNTFTNAAAIDANSLVTFTRSDGNTYTLDLASVGGGASAIDELSDVDTTTTAPANNDLLAWDGTNWTPQAPDFGLDAGTQFGQILWWSGGAWSTSPATTFDQHGFQFDGYTGTFVSRQYAHWFESSEMQGSGTNLTVPTDKSYFKVDASSNTQLTLEYGQHVNVIKRLMLEIEITGGASVTLPTNVIIADNTPSVITGDGKYMFEIFGRNGATNTYLKSWSDPTYSQVSSWKPLGTTIVSNNSMPVSPFGFSTVGEVFAGATEGSIVCREGTEYNSAIIPSAAVASFPATFPIHKGGSLLASVTFTSATDTIFDVTIGSADEVKIFYR